MKRPNGVTRGSSRILNIAPSASLCSSRSSCRSDAPLYIERNLSIANSPSPTPMRRSRKMIGPGLPARTSSAIAASSGEASTRTSVATTMSNVRLTAHSRPVSTGGRSSSSGTTWPGTKLARCSSSSAVVGTKRRRVRVLRQASASSSNAESGSSAPASTRSSGRSSRTSAGRSDDLAELLQVPRRAAARPRRCRGSRAPGRRAAARAPRRARRGPRPGRRAACGGACPSERMSRERDAVVARAQQRDEEARRAGT